MERLNPFAILISQDEVNVSPPTTEMSTPYVNQTPSNSGDPAQTNTALVIFETPVELSSVPKPPADQPEQVGSFSAPEQPPTRKPRLDKKVDKKQSAAQPSKIGDSSIDLADVAKKNLRVPDRDAPQNIC